MITNCTLVLVTILFSIPAVAIAQKIDKGLLISKSNEPQKIWYGQPYDPSRDITQVIYKTGEETHNITTFTFEENGSFDWNDNPKCGNNINATSGEGTWELNNDILILDFKNILTDLHGKRGVEKYKILSLKKEMMVLKVLK